MKSKIVEVPAIEKPIQASPGFAKKHLADYKLDICALCNFGCLYCSSNDGNYLRIRREPFAVLTEQQLGQRILPKEDPALTLMWPDVIEKLERQLTNVKPSWGNGMTLVFSMLTDGFGPELVKAGTTLAALRLLLEKTSFPIRVLTKNAIVGSPKWIELFKRYSGRFVVGLSIGTLDDPWAISVEVGTSTPTARLRALRSLQEAGVPTYGMACPIFPDLLATNGLERLLDLMQPATVEHLWAEPYNDRNNWQSVREGYEPGSHGHRWLTEVYGSGRKDLWSAYATDLYLRIRAKAQAEGWLHKVRYLLYEHDITKADAGRMGDLQGVMLQSGTGPTGESKNAYIAQLGKKGGAIGDPLAGEGKRG